MTPRTRLAAFAVVVAASFGLGMLVGEVAGPIELGTGSTAETHGEMP